jgi:hypothetical protein
LCGESNINGVLKDYGGRGCLGFLCFITKSANFDIEAKELTINENLRENEIRAEDGSYSEIETCSQADFYPWKFARCSITSAIGKTTASVWVPEAWLAPYESGQCEFILLSACVKEDEIETCQRILRRDPNNLGQMISVGIWHIYRWL